MPTLLKMENILITNACIITNNSGRVIPAGYLYIKNGQIVSFGTMSDIENSAANSRIIDAGGRIVMPGFINAHSHLYSQMARGLKTPKMRSFYEILDFLWWRFDNVLTEEAVYYSALLGLIEAIKAGVTTVIDHHASYNCIKGSLMAIERAFVETGMRGILCFEVSDRCGPKKAEEAIRENCHFISHVDRKKKDKDYLLRPLFGLHASFTLSEKTLKDVRAAMGNESIGYHIHTAEGPEDLKDAMQFYSKSVVERLYDEGILKEGTIAAHCIQINDRDIDILKASKCFVVHNPTSNMNNAVGWMPFLKLYSFGIPTGLGTDGMSNSVMADIKAASLIHKAAVGDSTVGWNEVFKSVMETNPAIVGSCFEQDIGKIEEGVPADVIIADVIPPTEIDPDNFWSHVLFGVINSRIHSTIVNGRVLMEGFEVKVIDESGVVEMARPVSRELWKRFYSPDSKFEYKST